MAAKEIFHSQLVYKDVLDARVQAGSRWLDIGCGCSLVADWIRDSVAFQKELIGRCELAVGWDPVDDRPHFAGLKKYVGEYSTLPFPEGYFDLITANMVVEHVEFPEIFLRQIRRLLAPNGLVILHTPNLHYPPVFLSSLLPSFLVRRAAQFLDGRTQEDIFRTYYRMNTRQALSHIRDFQTVELRCVPTGPLLRKVPLLGSLETVMLRNSSRPILKELQADWIVTLQNHPE